jgi:hypothetical protein
LRIEPVLAAPYVDSASDYYVIDDGLPRFAEDTPPERVT